MTTEELEFIKMQFENVNGRLDRIDSRIQHIHEETITKDDCKNCVNRTKIEIGFKKLTVISAVTAGFGGIIGNIIGLFR